MVPIVLSIAGSDPSSGAGVQADIRTFQKLGVYGLGVITSLTVQNTRGVSDTLHVDAEYVYKQIKALFEDIPINTVKIGMLGSSDIVEAVYEALKEGYPQSIVLDTPIASKNGFPLLEEEAIDKLKELLIPISTVITPNTHEASILSGVEIHSIEDVKESAKILKELGAKSVLIKGGHLQSQKALDILLYEDKFFSFEGKRYPFEVRGTGCVFASAIASNLAKGMELPESVRRAKDFINKAIAESVKVGKGYRVMPLQSL